MISHLFLNFNSYLQQYRKIIRQYQTKCGSLCMVMLYQHWRIKMLKLVFLTPIQQILYLFYMWRYTLSDLFCLY